MIKPKSTENERFCFVVVGWVSFFPKGYLDLRGSAEWGRGSLDYWIGRKSCLKRWKENPEAFRILPSNNNSAGWPLRSTVSVLGL